MVTRPLGALFFGWLGDKVDRKVALGWSLMGVAASTALIGFLPTSESIGILAPFFLTLVRLAQSFFAAGEGPLGEIYVLEQTDKQKQNLTSGLYNTSTTTGTLVASFIVALFASYELTEAYWRALFWAGGLTGIVGIYFRFHTLNSVTFIPLLKSSLWSNLKENKSAFFSIFLAAGFTYTTYSLPFVFMNGYVPLVTSISQTEIIKHNTLLLGLDILLLPLFGLVAQKYGKEKVMLFGIVGCLTTILPLFLYLNSGSTLAYVTLVRASLVVFGVAFSASYQVWALEQVPTHCRSTILSLAYGLGSQTLGAAAPFICLAIYQKTAWTGIPAVYLMVVSLGALMALKLSQRRVVAYQN